MASTTGMPNPFKPGHKHQAFRTRQGNASKFVVQATREVHVGAHLRESAGKSSLHIATPTTTRSHASPDARYDSNADINPSTFFRGCKEPDVK